MASDIPDSRKSANFDGAFGPPFFCALAANHGGHGGHGEGDFQGDGSTAEGTDNGKWTRAPGTMARPDERNRVWDQAATTTVERSETGDLPGKADDVLDLQSTAFLRDLCLPVLRARRGQAFRSPPFPRPRLPSVPPASSAEPSSQAVAGSGTGAAPAETATSTPSVSELKAGSTIM